MATPIYCDAAGPPHLADLIVTRIEAGDVLAWCDQDYLLVCRAILDALAQAEADQTAAEAEARLAAGGPTGPDPTSAGSSAAGDPPAEPPTRPVSGRRRPGPPSEPTLTPDARPGPNLGPSDDPGEAGDAPR